MQNPSSVAARDIVDYFRVNNIKVYDTNFDSWVVSNKYLFTRESTRLNRELGLYSINKGAHNMTREKR